MHPAKEQGTPLHQRAACAIVCSAVAALCLWQAPLRAEHAREFAGEFQISNVVDENDTVTFNLHVQVFNRSGADLKSATLTLADRRPGRDTDANEYQGSFENVSIADQKSLVLHGSFRIPAGEYRMWQHGAAPCLVVSYVSDAGEDAHSVVELLRTDGLAQEGEAR